MGPTLRRVMFAVLVCAGSARLCAQGVFDASAGSKVLALERLWAQAAELRDIKAMDAIFDDNFVYLDIDGRLMTKAQILADALTASPVQVVVESTGARLHGNTVIVTGVLRVKGMDGGKPYLHRGRFVDTWLFKKGHWVCVASDTTRIEP